MKRVISFTLVCTVLCAVLQFIFVSGYTQVSADNFDDIERSMIEVRYDEEMDESLYLSGKGYTAGACIYGDYLIVPVCFFSVADERRNMVVVYDMSMGTPVEVQRWDMTDLDMTVRSNVETGKQDIIYGIAVTDDYFLINVKIITTNPAASNRTYTTGLYVYENPFKGITLPKNPTRIMTNDPDIEKVGCTVLNDRFNFFDASRCGGTKMVMLGDKLVTYYGILGNHDITVTDMSGDYPDNTIYISEGELLKYTVDDVEISSVKATDIVFNNDKAYITALTDSEGSDGYREIGIFTVDFSVPESPVVTELTVFDSDILMTTDTQYCNTSINITGSYAYVTTFSYGTDNLKNKRTHLYTLKKTGDSFSFIKEFELSYDMYWIAGCGGMGSVLVQDDILIGLTGSGYHNNCSYLKFNDARDEIVSYKKVGTIVTDSKANALADGVVYGSKLIFPLMTTGVYNPTDSNKAVVCVFDILSSGIEFDDTHKLKNITIEDTYAVFDKPYTEKGINTLHITGKNISDKATDVQVIFGIYKNEMLIKTEVKEKHTISAGENIDIYEDIDLSNIEDLNNIVLKAFLWENFESIKPLTQICSPPEVGFSFILEEKSATSAGVYNEDNHLIRTLWSNVEYEAGTHKSSWDGKDDYGNFAPDGNYRIDVLANNVEYEHFVDVIGNTTDCSSWDTGLGSSASITDMAYDAATDRLYYCSDHVEGGYGLRYVDGESLSQNNLMDEYKPNMTAFRVAVDNERIYWASEEIQFNDYEGKGYRNFNSFIYATDEGATPYQFEYGERQPSKWTNVETNPDDPSGPYPYAINRYTVPYPEQNNRISGLEVQQEGNLLFSSYMDIGKVFVNDKNTGQLLYTYETAMPGGIALEGEDILWIAEQNEDETYTVNKYSVGTDGTLTYVSSIDSCFEKVMAMCASPKGGKLAVSNGGVCDIVYVFDTSTGEIITTYGSGESYYTDPTVKDDKLGFESVLFSRDGISEHTFVEFMSDTELLIGDSTNGRVYKLDISGEVPTIMDSILYLRGGYSVSYVKNDITRIFGDDMEYVFDYEKAEQYAQGLLPFEEAWSLKSNYLLQRETMYPEIKGTIASKFDSATKLENGITYFRMKHGDEGKNYLYMLVDNTLKATGIDVTNMDLHEDGSLWYRTYDGNECSFWKKNIESFDEQNIPAYGEPVLLAKIVNDNDRITPYNGNIAYSRVPVTDSGKIIMLKSMGPSFDNTLNEKTPMHLGAIDISSGYNNEWEWMASPRTHRGYQGFFPEDGYFDIGNGVAYTTWNPVTYENNVIYHYRGEGYQGKQVNKFLHYSDSGLLVGVFGRTFYEYGGQYEVGGSVWSGSIMELQPSNSMCVSIVGVPDNSDVAYIFQNTEGQGGGVHVTRVTGLESISVQSSEVTYRNALVKGVKYTCFNNSYLDSAYIDKTGVSNTFDIPCTSEGNTNHSVRFEGYYQAGYTGNTRFAVKTDGIASLSVDSKNIISNKTGESAGYLYLEKDTLYKFKLDVAAGENGISYLDIGYMSGAKYIRLDTKCMYCNSPEEADTSVINLLDGLSYGTALTPETYGWTTESYGGQGDSVISINTNHWNYDRNGDRDVYMYLMVKKNNSETRNEVDVIRSLGEINSSDYTVDMDVRYTGNFNRQLHGPRESTGSVIELLDKNDKIIANLYFAGGTSGYDYIYVYGNGQEICKFPKPAQHLSIEAVNKMIDVKINLPQNLKFYVEDGKVVTEYMGNRAVSDPIDADADITSPAKVRFARYNEFSGAGYSSQFNITRFMLYK